MDRKDWMYDTAHTSSTYINGVESFLKVVEANRVNVGCQEIWCPCMQCKNFKKFDNVKDIEFHLIKHGFMPRYTCWSMHGESLVERGMPTINLGNYDNDNLNDPGDNLNDVDDNLNDMLNDLETNIGDDVQEKLKQLFEDSEKPLYIDSEISKLDDVLKLFNLKSKHGWSDKSFTDLLVFLHDILPKGNELPVSLYQAKKMTCPMGLEVKRIHACPNDCMLYTNDFKNDHRCSCGASRYKRKIGMDEFDDDVTKNGPPAKLLWYFPIIPRLKRLFSNEKEAKLLRWHLDDRVKDGKLRHVADSPHWRNIDNMFPEFGNEIRNIRFGLSSDGFNPFGNLSSRHSTWPVLLCIYNLPPWLCMKRKYIMMSLLIQGPTQPGNKIDVYLAPLIDDLKTLWSTGVEVYDAYKKEYFELRAMIFCTISDFPAYGNLSGYSTKGKLACPIVNTEAPHKSTSASGKAPSHNASRQFQTSPQTHNCDIETSTSAYIPEFVSPEVNEVQQQRPSTVHIDAINFVDLDDFVESLWAIPIVSQILRPHNKESDQEKQARKIKSGLNAIKERPTWVQGVVSELEKHVGNYHLQPVPIEFSLPDGMYPYILKDFIEIEALLQVFANGWLDITIIHWLFYTVSNDGEKDNPCAFFGPNSINGEMCQQKPEEVKGHILGVYELHRDKQYFLAPYLANDHWSLFIISPMKKEVFILDSLKGNKDENSYLLSKVIEDSFKGTKFTWTMVECKQQKGGWECGYMVLGFMMEFVFTYHKDFPMNIWRTTRVATQKDIYELLRIIMPGFFARVFPNWSYTF